MSQESLGLCFNSCSGCWLEETVAVDQRAAPKVPQDEGWHRLDQVLAVEIGRDGQLLDMSQGPTNRTFQGTGPEIRGKKA